MQVHDELVLEVRDDALDPVQDEVVRLMAEAAQLAVPLVVDTGIGGNWDQAH
jgi:DNA polymerase-1